MVLAPEHVDLQRRFISAVNKVKLLSSLRKSLALPADCDLTEGQWSAIERPLLAIAARLHGSLKEKGAPHLRRIHQADSRRALTLMLGTTELELTRSFTYLDTFVDLLSQRLMPEMGALLGGCD